MDNIPLSFEPNTPIIIQRETTTVAPAIPTDSVEVFVKHPGDLRLILIVHKLVMAWDEWNIRVIYWHEVPIHPGECVQSAQFGRRGDVLSALVNCHSEIWERLKWRNLGR